MADPATKTSAKPESPPNDESIEALRAEFALLREENETLREIVEDVRRGGAATPEQEAEQAAAVQRMEDVLDFIAGAEYGDSEGRHTDPDKIAKAERMRSLKPPTRKEVEAAISLFRSESRAKIAKLRGIDPAERQTMTVGLRAHIAALKECAEVYYEREDI